MEKTLNTRLKLRYDTHENWLEKDPILLAGEMALATVSIAQQGTVNYVPSVLIKVGDGATEYSKLKFVYAKAADVVEACKNETALRTFVNSVIADAGIASSEAMGALAGRVTTAEASLTTLTGDSETTGSIANAIKTAVEAALADASSQDIVVLAESQAYADNVCAAERSRAEGIESGLRADINIVKSDYLKSSDRTALQNQIDAIVNNPDTEGIIDSINEFTTYISEHGEVAEGFRVAIEARATKEEVSDALEQAKAYSDSLNHEGAIYTAASGGGLKLDENNSFAINDEITFILDCGNATNNV